MAAVSTATLLRRALSSLLEGIPDLGKIDLRRLDHDEAALRLGTVGLLPDGTPSPYWSIQVGAFRDTPAGFGEASVRPVYRDYAVRIEGWRGFVGIHDYTDAWELLTEQISSRLQTGHQAIAQTAPGFMDWQNFGAPTLDIVRLGDSTARAHHALFQFDARLFLRLTR